VKRPNTRFLLAAAVGALAFCLGAAGCAGHRHHKSHMTEEQCDELEAKKEQGRQLASQVGCTKCGTPGCKGGAGCHGHKEPEPATPQTPPPPANCEKQSPGMSDSGKTQVVVTGTMRLLPSGDLIVETCDGERVAKGTWTGKPLVGEVKYPVTLSYWVSGGMSIKVGEECDKDGIKLDWKEVPPSPKP
jgi:hypothetical protein